MEKLVFFKELLIYVATVTCSILTIVNLLKKNKKVDSTSIVVVIIDKNGENSVKVIEVKNLKD